MSNKTGKNKKILFIAYYYYPNTAIGSVRSEKFVKYLSELGWDPCVVTIKDKYIKNKEESRIEVDTKIYRAGIIYTFNNIYLIIKSFFFKRRIDNKQNPDEGSSSPIFKEDYSHISDVPVWKKLLNLLSSFPDAQMGWIIPATIKAIRVIRRDKIDIQYSSAPPHTCHVIALLVKKFTGCKWVVDFRDPWSTVKKSDNIDSSLFRWMERRLEKIVIKNADMIISTTRELQKLFENLYPQIDKEKFFAVYNGFDDVEIPVCYKSTKTGQVQFLYAGNLYRGRDPHFFIEAVGSIMEKDGLGGVNISIDFYGNFAVDSNKIHHVIEEYSLEEIVSFNQPVVREEYLKMISLADVLVLIQSPNPDTAACVPGKTFEYLATGNHILALVSSGATANILSEFSNVELAHPYKKDEIQRAVLRILEKIKTQRGVNSDYYEKLQKYTRKKQAEYFSELLNNRL